MRFHPGDIYAFEFNCPWFGHHRCGYQVEKGRLAGAVGAYQSDDLAAFDLEIDIGYGSKAAEVLGDSLTFKYWHISLSKAAAAAPAPARPRRPGYKVSLSTG